MDNNANSSVSLLLEERSGRKRINEPITVGLPFPKGIVFDPSLLSLWDAAGQQLPLQTCALAQWFDGSPKRILLDFQASVEANARISYRLRYTLKQCQSSTLVVRESGEQIIVDTGRASFFLGRQSCKPFDRVVVQGNDVIDSSGSSFVLTDGDGQEYFPHIHEISIETAGPLRTTVRVDGELRSASRVGLARFVVRLSFYAGSGFVQMRITLHNPRAARHIGGLWDLGDEGSIYFKDFSFHLPLRTESSPRISWTADHRPPTTDHRPATADPLHPTPHLEIYQDSSGGENWRSANHVNRFGQVMHTFRGYRVTTDGSLLEEGLRATPILTIRGEHGGVTATIEQFWQNFPKAMEAHGNELVLRLFPRQYNDVFELQGGEQKTHTIYLQFSAPGEPGPDLGWVHDRLVPRATPGWYAASKACGYLTPRRAEPNSDFHELIDTAVDGPRSFFARREIIDEYGWRHFGDLYADHEAVNHRGDTPLIAHYNNQYDAIYGFIAQYLRTGDRRWLELGSDLARHTIDIDIYHTQEDRPAYNGGLFWHTDHYLNAGTATHRSYSKAALTKRDARFYGGGPSNEHNYTTGLLQYYYLTGDETAREAVLSLADWVINMDDGMQRPFGTIDRRPTGLSSSTASREYHGPGRGAGNSINALLDAYALTHQDRYLAKAELLIRRCIHPADDIQERNLDAPEQRWSYLVFLQVLGKYLDYKIEQGQLDRMYVYAQASLLHYAGWMLVHEVPYATVLHKVEIPTETWPAQDIRKSVVFHLAAKHAIDPLRSRFQKKGEFFFQACIQDLRTFPTCTLTRPIVLLLTNAYVHSYFQAHPEETAPHASKEYDFGHPKQFRPQFSELYWAREKLSAWMSRVVNWRRIMVSGLRKNYVSRLLKRISEARRAKDRSFDSAQDRLGGGVRPKVGRWSSRNIGRRTSTSLEGSTVQSERQP
jgi:hypothetical protein